MFSSKKHIFFFIFLWFCLISGYTQTATISGIIKTNDGEPIEGITIAILEDAKITTISDAKGHYSVDIPANKDLTIAFYNINFKQINQKINLKPGENMNFSPIVEFKNEMTAITIVGENRTIEMTRIDPKLFYQLPTAGGSIEDLIKTQMGVTSNNELSSSYSVRGGNFDENLVYVNDIEVYRPFLVRSGQQEGLSFANPGMVQDMKFSAGGFEAKYGDKMSSVLDITYRKPTKFGGSASASLLGGSLNLEGVSKNRLISWSVGSRYKSNAYLLKGMDTKGEYKPRFYDAQAFVTFNINPKWTVEVLANLANNKYLVVPTDRETTFGTVNNAVSFKVYFDGQEVMQYNTFMGGVSTTYMPNKTTKLKLIASGYTTKEDEIYTVQGQYYIDQLEADFGNANFGQVAFNRGIGTFLNNGRNSLQAQVYNIEHKGTKYLKRGQELLWGLRFQNEIINDKLSEWRMIDSAGFVNPYSPTEINLSDVYKAKINLNSTRIMEYVEYRYNKTLRDSSTLTFTGGARGNYWTLNNQFIVSPRATLAFKPNWKKDFVFKLSGGYYYQPPFYRELRGIDGTINKNIRAQQSIHCVLSSDYNFNSWRRPFKFVVAAYWKQLNDLITYEIDNVRVRYFANNHAKGYATGIDFRVNGEFVKGVESWASIGLLRTYEYSKDNIHYDYFNKEGEKIIKGYTFDQVKTDSTKIDPGYIPRPTDQLVTFNLFFQDYLPKHPELKMNLNLIFGSGLPFGPPTHERWRQVFRMPPYRRVDIGFAYNILREGREFKRKNFMNHVLSMWLNLEVLNLLGVNNTVSYTWIKDVTGRQYAVPNYLTNRMVNVKIQVRF
ncbi:MAG TPA: TonB-dependent receptor [Bacteroidia bacterium]|nr:TonB-dependent receptor [Bacteroidia bacterium]